jgi:hypothetical protein
MRPEISGFEVKALLNYISVRSINSRKDCKLVFRRAFDYKWFALFLDLYFLFPWKKFIILLYKKDYIP